MVGKFAFAPLPTIDTAAGEFANPAVLVAARDQANGE